MDSSGILKSRGARAKLFVRWEEIVQWFDEGRNQAWIANELGLSYAHFGTVLGQLISRGKNDPRPKPFRAGSLGHTVMKRWAEVNLALESGQSLRDVSQTFGWNYGALSTAVAKIQRTTDRRLSESALRLPKNMSLDGAKKAWRVAVMLLRTSPADLGLSKDKWNRNLFAEELSVRTNVKFDSYRVEKLFEIAGTSWDKAILSSDRLPEALSI